MTGLKTKTVVEIEEAKLGRSSSPSWFDLGPAEVLSVQRDDGWNFWGTSFSSQSKQAINSPGDSDWGTWLSILALIVPTEAPV
jgi:hypothetical protein